MMHFIIVICGHFADYKTHFQLENAIYSFSRAKIIILIVER